MILHDVNIYGQEGLKHIHISCGIIRTITGERKKLEKISDEIRIELDGLTATPGFINSHDHLDFNLYPQLGNRIYNNYTEWGKEIHAVNAEAIETVKKIPLRLRIQWGLYKNLLNGFTTVVNHGEKLNVDNDLIDVFQKCQCLHSPAFEKKWKLKLNNPFRKNVPVVMHIGEGTDEVAMKEIDELRKWNLIKRRLVAVHGVPMNEEQAADFKGLVWCPASNYFLLGKTAAVDKLKHKTKVVFGTDSTLTATWHLSKHFETAVNSKMVTEKELMDMLTIIPAGLWGLKDRGRVEEKMRADMILTEKRNNIFNNEEGEIQLIIIRGEICFASEKYKETNNQWGKDFDTISIRGKSFFVKEGIAKLIKEILFYYPQAVIPFSY